MCYISYLAKALNPLVSQKVESSKTFCEITHERYFNWVLGIDISTYNNDDSSCYILVLRVVHSLPILSESKEF